MAKKAYRSLVEWALNKGYVVSVFDGEEWQIRRSSKPGEIFDAIKSVEESQLVINEMVAGPPQKVPGGKIRPARRVGWALILLDGPGNCDPEETVVDYSVGEIDEWFNEYVESINQ